MGPMAPGWLGVHAGPTVLGWLLCLWDPWLRIALTNSSSAGGCSGLLRMLGGVREQGDMGRGQIWEPPEMDLLQVSEEGFHD